MITPLNKSQQPLSRWRFTIDGKTKHLFALNRKHAEQKAKKNGWI